MFDDRSQLIAKNPPALYYGVAATDIDGDGQFELFIAGNGFPNRILRWDGAALVDLVIPPLMDAQRRAIGVAAADLDGDGQEEIYVLNTDTFAGRKQVGDRLFDLRDGAWVDLFELPYYESALNLTAGRSVVAVDRFGTGRYGFFVANYGGPMRLYEMDASKTLNDMARSAGINYATGGRALVALPLVSQHMDIFAANERGPNLLFRNRGDGTFEEIAQQSGVWDRYQHGRGVAVADLDEDGRFDLVCGNWEGPHRVFMQLQPGVFEDMASAELATPSRVRTVIAADFDNDGEIEIFFNNIGEPNRLFGVRSGAIVALDIGAALEPDGLGTGAAVCDIDGDGTLELLVAHGESAPQPLSLFRAASDGNHWLRVLPLTAQGAPARGAVVALTAGGRTQRRAIDAGSGYLCQMEPVAHFGLGATDAVERVTVRWLSGREATIDSPAVDQPLVVPYPE